MTKTQLLLIKISHHINQLLIAGYIKEEVLSSLKYLHYYKLKNIEKNLNEFSEYLLFLNLQNTEKVKKLGKECRINKKSNSDQQLSYFVVANPLKAANEKKLWEKINNHGYELLTLIQGIKGILILSIDEFCNASKTRMDIHNMLMQREKKLSSCKKSSCMKKKIAKKSIKK